MKRLFILMGLLVAMEAVWGQKYSFNVEVTGKGTPLLMIPGLSSSGEVWDGTVEKMKDRYECHVVTLPGFAGQPSIETENYLQFVTEELIAYVKKEKLKKPVIIGHSLGGFLTLSIALNEPKLASKLIIVDGLPYLGAAQNPTATVESNKVIAANMRKQISTQTKEEFEAAQPTFLKTMITSDEDVEVAMEWGRNSDRVVVAQALYELFQTDLREEISEIETPTLVLGAWIAYKEYGVTKEMTLRSYTHQFRNHKDVKIVMSDKGKHFLMWDDPEFLMTEITNFLN